MYKSLFTPPLAPPLTGAGKMVPLLSRGGGRGGVIKLFYLSLLLCSILLAACGGNPTKEELASLAAKGYYQHLIEGDYDHFLEGRLMADSLPDDYRTQLIDGYHQFMAQQQARGGITEVRVSRAYTDSTQQYTSVMLMLCYGDSTTEEVIVPMVERNGRWMMK